MLINMNDFEKCKRLVPRVRERRGVASNISNITQFQSAPAKVRQNAARVIPQSDYREDATNCQAAPISC